MSFSGRLGPRIGANDLSLLAARLRAEGRATLNLSDSNPTRHGLSPSGVLAALANAESLRYEPDPRGLRGPREALAASAGGEPDDYFLCASTSEAYGWLFRLLCDPGEAVLVPSPGYPLFESLAGLEAVRAVPYRLEYAHSHGWSIDLDDLRLAARRERARAVVLINPNNPTGSYVRAAEREAVVGLCAELGMALVADEVFFPYMVEGPTGEEPRRLAGEGGCLTFALDGLSKLLCLPQLKLGWIRVSGPAAERAEASARLEIVADAYLSAGAPAMNALPSLLGEAGAFVRGVRARLAGNLDAARTLLGGPGSPYRVLRCDGGWTALVDIPRYRGEEETALGLLEAEGLAVQPGYFFDMERDGRLALSLILEPGIFADGVSRLRRYVDGLAGA